MMKKIIISGIFLIFALQLSVFGQIPVGYYNSIDEKQKSELKTALHKILKEHTVLSYNNLWYYFRTTDVKPDSDGEVWDMYSNIARYYVPATNSNYSVSGMNKEHSLPRSWWNPSPANEKDDAYSDLNHLYPSDAQANNAKSNYIMGKTGNSLNFNNGVTKTGTNVYPGAPTVRVFEPADEYKGDFARIYMYMVTCYENYAQQWRTEALYMFNKETYPVFQNWTKNMILEWHRTDPVSKKERDRNEEVYRYQNNRNPFVDFPQLAEYIWGDSTEYIFELPKEYYAYIPMLITPVNLTDLFFGEIKKNSEILQTVTLKGIYLTGNVSIMLWGGDKKYFKLTSVSAPADAVTSEEGYNLVISYNPDEYGEHTTRLLIQGGGMEGSSVVYLKGICSENGSGVIPIRAQSPDLYVQNDIIYFRTYTPNDRVSIYDSLGKLIHSEKGTGQWQEFKCPQSGIYIVQLNGKALKTVVNANK